MSNDSKDDLEKFIVRNKVAFSQESPQRDLWPEVNDGLRIRKSRATREVWIWRAASVVLLMVTLFLYQRNTTIDTSSSSAITPMDMNEFDQVESFYVSQISEKSIQISDFQKNEVSLNPAYEVDLRRLEAMYEVLKVELKNNPSKEVKDALTLNLLIRINLLNNQLQYIEETETSHSSDQAV